MRNFPKRLSLLISVLLVSLLSVTASGTEAAFEDSSEAQITGTAATLSAGMNGGTTVFPYFLYWDAIPVNGSTAVNAFTITNTGTLDGNFSIVIDPSASTLPQKTILNHTYTKVTVNEKVVYDGPLNGLKTVPVRINIGETANFNIDLSILYSSNLDTAVSVIDWQSIPVVTTFTPTDIPNSTLSVSGSGPIMYRMLKWKVTLDDMTRAPSYFNDTCVLIEWNRGAWSTGNYTFEYSKNSNLSGSTTITTTSPRASLKSLPLNTQYYYRIRADDSARPTWSDINTFTTGSSDGSPYWLTC